MAVSYGNGTYRNSAEKAGRQTRKHGDLMKVLMLNGSPRKNGNSATALQEMAKVFAEEGIETELIQVGSQPIRGCISCGSCMRTGKCVFDDLVNETAPKFEAADGLVVASPVYYASANATLVAFLTRLFYSTHFDKTMKVGAAISSARRSGTTATYDELNKFFGISGMPIASGQYWNGVHGREAGEATQDAEGMQMVRTLARNMAFLMKSIALGKAQYGLPQREAFQRTNFIR
jgi:multimeric flavodoxin WrbA